MAKAVFTHKPGSIYDDDPYVKYHFPRSYLRTVEATLGDFIVYYEPGRHGLGDRNRNGRKAYFATARVVRIEHDPLQADHYYAFVDDYLDFERAVKFREEGGTYERHLAKPDGTTNKGQFGINVRRIADDEFAAICQAGFTPLAENVTPHERHTGLMEDATAFADEMIDWSGTTGQRAIVPRLLHRPFRDAAFQNAVRNAYTKTCALTGLKVINGGGRAEVEAAHIVPVASKGPDSVRNGLALSRTAHWMFDRGLVSIGDDYSILTSSDRLPEQAIRLFNSSSRLTLPVDPALRPAPDFLAWHREHVFKG